MIAFLILFLCILVPSTSSAASTYDEGLKWKRYKWEVVENTGSSEKIADIGESIEFIFSDSPGGLELIDATQLELQILINGEDFGIGESITAFDQLALSLKALWAMPIDTMNNDDSFVLKDDYYIKEISGTYSEYDAKSGILLATGFRSDSDSWRLEYNSSIFTKFHMNYTVVLIILILIVFFQPYVKKYYLKLLSKNENSVEIEENDG